MCVKYKINVYRSYVRGCSCAEETNNFLFVYSICVAFFFVEVWRRNSDSVACCEEKDDVEV